MLEERVFTNCTNGGAVFVHVRDGKIVRVRPIVFDETDALTCPHKGYHSLS